MEQDTSHLRAPAQKRSIERVELILETARALIAIHGSAGLKIQDIAKQAGITAGSMYQYFPNKAAIIQALGQRYLDNTAGMISDALSPPPQNKIEVLMFINQMFDAYYQMHLEDPVLQDIWMGTHADKNLKAIDDADTERNAKTIYNACEPLFDLDQHSAAEIKNAILLSLKLTNTTLSVALSQKPEEADMTISLFKEMMVRTLDSYLD